MTHTVFTKVTSPISISIDENGTCWAFMGYEDEVIPDVETCDDLIKALTEAREAIRERYGKNK